MSPLLLSSKNGRKNCSGKNLKMAMNSVLATEKLKAKGWSFTVFVIRNFGDS